MKKNDAKIDIEKTSRAISEVATQSGESEENVRADIEEAIRVGMSDPDPAVQARWKAISPDGGPVKPKQLIAWLTTRLRNSENTPNKTIG